MVNKPIHQQEADMFSIVNGTVSIQTVPESVPAPPSWFGEVVLVAAHLRKHGVLTKISERVRFARRRFGHDEVIDFLGRSFRLRDQWRAHPGGVLRAAPAVCDPIHGVI